MLLKYNSFGKQLSDILEEIVKKQRLEWDIFRKNISSSMYSFQFRLQICFNNFYCDIKLRKYVSYNIVKVFFHNFSAETEMIFYKMSK